MDKMRVIVVGGGFSGCAAAIAASKAGAQVLLLERTDMLSGAGIRAGRMNYNGKLVAAEEAKALGGGEVFEALETIILHRSNIVDEEHVYIYNTAAVDSTMRRALRGAGVEFRFKSRAKEAEKENDLLKAVVLDNGERIEGDVFIDSTGSFGGMDNCTRYGKGCVMCLHRCPIFGNRISVAVKAGAAELPWRRPDGTPGRISPSVTVFKESLKPEMRERLEKEGAISIPLPKELIDYSKENHFQGIRGRHQIEHINIVDIGLGGKCVGMGYFSLADMRTIPGFETVVIEHPMGGAIFNFINHVSASPRDHALRVREFKNVFIGGERSGPGGIAEAIATGMLAGHNAARASAGLEPVILPRSTAIGDFIAFIDEVMAEPERMSQGYSMGHGEYFERMKELGLYSPDAEAIRKRIDADGLTGVLAQKVV